jgi:hypothetical protein
MILDGNAGVADLGAPAGGDGRKGREPFGSPGLPHKGGFPLQSGRICTTHPARQLKNRERR